MKKLILCLSMFICILCWPGSSEKPDSNSLTAIREINSLAKEKRDTEQDFLEELSGRHEKELVAAWGKPDGMLSGFWGDVWYLDDHKEIIVYYDRDGAVENIRITERLV